MGKAIDHTGEKIGRLTLLKRKRENKRTYYYCKCDCGNKLWIRADSLNGNTNSCGCFGEENYFKAKDITGKKFGRLTALKATDKRDKNNGSVVWECKCDCGKLAYVAEYVLNEGSIRSCGCLGKENSKNNMQKAIKKHLEIHIVEGTNIPIISRNKLQSNNKSGCTGVRWDKTRKKWISNITFRKKVYYLGRHIKREDAIKARKQAEEKLFGEFLDWYNNVYLKEHK
ncbi:AP2 domain-containing protein [Clostridium sp. HBUAS56017]|uniref:AP2 domain-containing protein n=1 Tax=Clostridium sp. HBUAS56017 TaxID=2571128 RepID=UPI0011776FE3|nr:AP2 domain-containing protein [Clostridium sp. HBUAS56017]